MAPPRPGVNRRCGMTSDYLGRLVNRDDLRGFLQDRFGPASTYSIDRHSEGHSNETLFVVWGDRELVIRRPPPGETADTAHDVTREARVTRALVETPVPAPDPLAVCEDHAIMGSDFYVMERLDGDVLRDDELARFGTADTRRALATELVDSLVAVHDVNPEAVGLDEFGRPDGYTRRQVTRWTKQLEWAFDTTHAVREVPALVAVGDWLEANLPTTHPETLVHGDFKLDNVMFAPGTSPEAIAIFDWEMSTLGDPLTDLGWLLLFWQDDGDPAVAIPELFPSFTTRDGYPSRQELISHYERQAGREFTNGRFYRVLAAYKMAALGEMFLARHLNDDADDPLYPTMETAVPRLAEQALAFAQGDTDAL
ncbi:MAG: putative aminoglycoside phosphotransferase [uncultured archaeon A07HR60]|nr:MAG: putative aminoglycoside phosphotransferase [uncultured archaeon A07HR60]